MSRPLMIPDGKDIKNWIGKHWGKIILWVALVICGSYIWFHLWKPGEKTTVEVKKTVEYKALQRHDDSLQLVAARRSDSLFEQGLQLVTLQSNIQLQRSGYKLKEKQLNEVLRTPANKLPDYSDREITNFLERKYGYGAESAVEANDSSR